MRGRRLLADVPLDRNVREHSIAPAFLQHIVPQVHRKVRVQAPHEPPR